MPFDYNLRFAGYPVIAQDMIANGPVFDELAIVVYDSNLDGADLRIDFDANADHYTTEALAAHHGRFLELLARLAASAGMPLHRLVVLDAGERRTLLEEFNATAREVPETTLPELFEAQVARTPEAVAVVFGDETLSYAELNARANRLAHHLIGLGVGPECLVGICLERSFDMVVALLATLKAGGAYLPLDPDYPEARLAQMLADAAPAVVLSTGACAGGCRRRRRCSPWTPPRCGRRSAGPRRTTPPTRSGSRPSFPGTRPTSSTPPAPLAHPRACSLNIRIR